MSWSSFCINGFTFSTPSDQTVIKLRQRWPAIYKRASSRKCQPMQHSHQLQALLQVTSVRFPVRTIIHYDPVRCFLGRPSASDETWFPRNDCAGTASASVISPRNVVPSSLAVRVMRSITRFCTIPLWQRYQRRQPSKPVHLCNLPCH